MLDVFFFNDTATTEIYTLSLHDALPICCGAAGRGRRGRACSCRSRILLPAPARLPAGARGPRRRPPGPLRRGPRRGRRSEEHTSELQSRQYLVCRLLLEKKKKWITIYQI